MVMATSFQHDYHRHALMFRRLLWAFAALECELRDRKQFGTKAEARMAVFDVIKGCYNPGRRCSTRG
jgi:hypothetical protein